MKKEIKFMLLRYGIYLFFVLITIRNHHPVLFIPTNNFSWLWLILGFILVVKIERIYIQRNARVILLHPKMMIIEAEHFGIAPIMEELGFRNCIYYGLYSYLPIIAEPGYSLLLIGLFLIVSSPIFAIFHYPSFNERTPFSYFFIYGLLFGSIYLLTENSILLVFIVHSFSNLLEYRRVVKKMKNEHPEVPLKGWL